jgi:hypothetical protein
MNHLTDKELIDYTIKFSDDSEKVRLATAMERITGAIIDDLVDAGRYITLLEDEIRIRDEDILQLRKELEERKALSIADLIQELKQEIKTAKWMAEEARKEQYRAETERNDAKAKLSMWAKLNGQV